MKETCSIEETFLKDFQENLEEMFPRYWKCDEHMPAWISAQYPSGKG